MTAAILSHPDFDHGAFLSGKLDDEVHAARVIEADDEDEVFGMYLAGTLDQAETSPTRDFDRIYHIDEQAGEMWTINPESGCALSSGTWEFEEA